MRIITRPDFDGVICAILLKNALKITKPIKWVEPIDIQQKKINISDEDIIANLPFNENCFLWFDHHCSNKPKKIIKGAFSLAPSAAAVIYEYYKKNFTKKLNKLVIQANKIDSADLSLQEISQPEKNQYLLLSMTISGRDLKDEFYWNHLVEELSNNSIDQIMKNPIIYDRCKAVIRNNILYEKILLSNTNIIEHISVSDFRAFKKTPTGNRFLVHSLFNDCTVNVKIFFKEDSTIISASKSIFKKDCLVNLGKMFKKIGGGGHDGAGACSFPKKMTDTHLNSIIKILLKNKSN